LRKKDVFFLLFFMHFLLDSLLKYSIMVMS